jgi:hypothetical protein
VWPRVSTRKQTKCHLTKNRRLIAPHTHNQLFFLFKIIMRLATNKNVLSNFLSIGRRNESFSPGTQCTVWVPIDLIAR